MACHTPPFVMWIFPISLSIHMRSASRGSRHEIRPLTFALSSQKNDCNKTNTHTAAWVDPLSKIAFTAIQSTLSSFCSYLIRKYNTMGNLLGKEKPLKEVLRENKRMITRAVRELDREKASLEKEEKRLTMEIKKAARENQMGSVKIMAKDLVRTRQAITKFIEMRSHLQGVGLKLQTVKSHEAMASAMQNTAKAMASMNKAVNVKTITKMLADFERENARTEMMQEVMGDAIDDAMADGDTAEEEDAVVNQVLDEIGVTFGEELPQAAMGSPPVAQEAAPAKVAVAGGDGGGDAALDDLEARLNNLKR